ncbi:MAG: DUF3368 domain-containing protein [Chloroflexota bacterium]
MPVVSNSSPLILYAKIGRLDLLRQAFRRVLIPTAVRDEVLADGEGRPGTAEIAAAPWIELRVLATPGTAQALMDELDRGEAEAIALALELGTQFPLLIDDRKARRSARARGVSVFGSAGVLVRAKHDGAISLVRPILNELRAAGLFLTDTVYDEALALAGE